MSSLSFDEIYVGETEWLVAAQLHGISAVGCCDKDPCKVALAGLMMEDEVKMADAVAIKEGHIPVIDYQIDISARIDMSVEVDVAETETMLVDRLGWLFDRSWLWTYLDTCMTIGSGHRRQFGECGNQVDGTTCVNVYGTPGCRGA